MKRDALAIILLFHFALCLGALPACSNQTAPTPVSSEQQTSSSPAIPQSSGISANESAPSQQTPQAQQQEPIYGKTEPLPPYRELVSNIGSFKGRKFKTIGRVTSSDTYHGQSIGKSGDVYIYSYWDSGNTTGEVSCMRIPKGMSTKGLPNRNDTFTAIGTLEGLDDNGHPQFSCISFEQQEKPAQGHDLRKYSNHS